MVVVIIPTLNAGVVGQECFGSVGKQNVYFFDKFVIDSGSSDNTVIAALDKGFQIIDIARAEFDHGGTRAKGVELAQSDFVVFLTQDAVLCSPESISNLIAAFEDEQVAAVYGRQLPHDDADPLAHHARLKNYGPKSYVTGLEDDFPVGVRKAYMSNSFSAYRKSALMEVGNFESKLILGEDFVAATKLLKAGYKIAYVAEAEVKHSHNYTILEEFRRYFDIGVFHSSQSWMIELLGKPGGEGVAFALDQLVFLVRTGKFLWLPRSVISSLAKFVGYKLGLVHHSFPTAVNRRLAMHKGYFGKV